MAANINAVNARGRTALIRAVNDGNLEDVQRLIDAGADVNKPDKLGYTPLMFAVDKENSLELVNALLSAGADVNKESYKRHDTALITACEKGYVKLVEALLALGLM